MSSLQDYYDDFVDAALIIMKKGKQMSPKAQAPWEQTVFSHKGLVAKVSDDANEIHIMSAFPSTDDGTIFNGFVTMDHHKLTVLQGSLSVILGYIEEEL